MKDKKEYEELMEYENAEHDDVDTEIEELKAEIDRMIKQLDKISPKEKAIMEKIRMVLDEHDLKYSYDEDRPKHIGLGFNIDNKPFKIHIILQNGKVIFKLSYPFVVQSNAYPLMCMFMAEFNENKAFSHLNIDSDDGELMMEYSYLLENPSHFDEKYFWVYMISLIRSSLEIYTKVAHLSMGMVSSEDREFYKKMLKMAIETINGDFDDDNVSYGTESLRSDSHSDISHLFEEDCVDADEDDFESEEDVIPDFVSDEMRGRGMPSFEEFMSMKVHTEEDDGEKSKIPAKESANLLSMFAKRAIANDAKEVGGKEDE